MSQENVELVRRAVAAFNRGDRAAALAYDAPEAEWHTSGEFADQGVYRGHAGIERLFAELDEDIEELRFSVSEIRDLGDRVFVAGRTKGRGKRSKADFEQPFWYVVTIRDGLIVRIYAYREREEALEAVGLSD